MIEFWGAFEPTGSTVFEGVDRYLLRRSLEAAHRGRTGTAAASAAGQPLFEQSVLLALNSLSFAGDELGLWKDFFDEHEIYNIN
jgi:hypothetical protein